MEIRGRECEEVKVGEHTYYFITKFKGREYMKIQNLVLGEMDLKKGDSQKNRHAILVNVPMLFELFCMQIDDGSLAVSKKYVEDLEMEDFEKIQGKLTDILADFFTKIQ